MRNGHTLGVCLAGMLSLTTFTGPASADEAPGGAAYRLSLDVDAPILLVAGGLASGFFFLSEGSAPRCAPRCDPGSVNALDRPFAGRYSAAWGRAGDIATAATVLVGPLSLLLAGGARAGFNDSLVVGEAMLVTSALQVVTSYAAQRPRPRVYGDEAPLGERDDANAGRSFFSGHVANGVAATVATSRAFFRLERPTLAWTMLGLGMAGSTLIGVGRVGAGSHFPSDVLVGAAVGAGVGIAVSAWHAPGRPLPSVQTAAGATRATLISVSGSF